MLVKTSENSSKVIYTARVGRSSGGPRAGDDCHDDHSEHPTAGAAQAAHQNALVKAAQRLIAEGRSTRPCWSHQGCQRRDWAVLQPLRQQAGVVRGPGGQCARRARQRYWTGSAASIDDPAEKFATSFRLDWRRLFGHAARERDLLAKRADSLSSEAAWPLVRCATSRPLPPRGRFSRR